MLPGQYYVQDETTTAALAARLAPQLRAGDVVTLTGDLGAGKTAFARALINARAGTETEVPSPTFTLVQVYDLADVSIWHFDLYRLEEEEKDILEIGWDEARRSGVSLVEWPDRLGGLLPRDRLEINIQFDPAAETARRITITPVGKLADRIKL